MKATVPFAYTTRIQAPRSGKHQEVVVAEMIEYDIPEIGLAETELVATWSRQLGNRPQFRHVECRLFRGDFYYESGGNNPILKDAFVNGISRREVLSYGTDWYCLARHVLQYEGHEATACKNLLLGKKSRPLVQTTTDRACDRASSRRTAIAGMADLLFVDGKLWCRAGLPRLELSLRNQNGRTRGKIDIVALPKRGSPPGIHPPMLPTPGRNIFKFPIDAFDKLEAFSDRLGIPVRSLVGEIDILSEFEKGLDPASWLTLNRAVEIVRSVEDNLGALPVDAVTAWLDLRTAISAGASDPVEHIHGLICSLAECMERCSHDCPPAFGYRNEIEIIQSLLPPPLAHPHGAGPRG